MVYPLIQTQKEDNFLLIGITGFIGLTLIIIVYYIVTSKSPRDFNKLYTMPKPSDLQNMIPGSTMQMKQANIAVIPTGANYAPVPTASSAGVSAPQVFNVKNNVYTFKDAPAVCGAIGAEVATIEQLIEAHKQGADWCTVGWTKDGLAGYPTQESTWKILQDDFPEKRNACGVPGINLVRNDPNLLYGVNCYGPKPKPKGNEKVRQHLISDKQIALNARIAELQKNMNAIGVAPFNQDKWAL
jgi:hypothetical protein